MTRCRCRGHEVVTTCPPWRDTESLLYVPFFAHSELEKACALWYHMRLTPDGRCLQYVRRAGLWGLDRRMIYLRPFDKQTKQNKSPSVTTCSRARPTRLLIAPFTGQDVFYSASRWLLIAIPPSTALVITTVATKRCQGSPTGPGPTRW